ncbi:MAG: NADH-quinone oxidoreductase subunit M [Bacteroidales bacterium]
MNLLIILLLIPLAVMALLVICRKNTWGIAAVGSGIQLLYTFFLAGIFINNPNSNLIIGAGFTWFTPLNIQFSYALDGLSMLMILLTALVVFAGTLVSYNINAKKKEFFVLYMLLALGAFGYFISTDLFALFFFLEIAIVPKFLLIGIYGSGNKEKNAMKLALMLSAGSAMVFVGLIAFVFLAYSQTGVISWDLTQLANIQLPAAYQGPLYLLLFTGFGIFTAMFPFHSWAPDGHSSAPIAASMFLAGVSMKLGGYGCWKVATVLLPLGAAEYSWVFVVLGTIGVIYGAYATLRQKDIKYMNAFSSVSHCNLVIFGIAIMTSLSIQGAMLQMISHGMMTALFFAVIGMIYNRLHTRDMEKMGGLINRIPFIATALILVGLCSLGLPGMSGFVAEMTIFVGAWEKMEIGYRIATIISCSSIVVTTVYIMRAIGKVTFGEPHSANIEPLQDADIREKTVVILLMTCIFIMGLAPMGVKFLLNIN